MTEDRGLRTENTVRCIVNVATGPYVALQKRLLKSLEDVNWRGGIATWTDAWPPGSPTHLDTPYAFKLFAIREAQRRGHTTILWLDSPCTAASALDPVFERTEQEGHVFVAGSDRLGNWASDACLSAFGLGRDQAMDLKLLIGTFIGLDFTHARTRAWFEAMERCCAEGLFRGAYLNVHAPEELRRRKKGKPEGRVSDDPRCWGHRHDEAVGSCLASRHAMAFTPIGDLFDIDPASRAPVRSEY